MFLGFSKESTSRWDFQKQVMHDLVGPLERGDEVTIHVSLYHSEHIMCYYCKGGTVVFLCSGCMVTQHRRLVSQNDHSNSTLVG